MKNQKIKLVCGMVVLALLAPLGLYAQDEEKESVLPPLTIHVEQLSWDTFRFRPSFRLGATESEYLWHFGDSSTDDQRVVEHKFEAPGVFQVELGLVDEQGTPYSSNTQINVGFFNLANWRLWVLIGLLALIIIVAAIVAGVTDTIVPKVSEDRSFKKPLRPSKKKKDDGPLQSLSEESGNLDVLATTGLETGDLSKELALLESLDADSKAKPVAATKKVVVQTAKPLVKQKIKLSKPKLTPKPKVKPPKTDTPIGDLNVEEIKAGLRPLGEDKPIKKPAVKKPAKKKTNKSSKAKN